MIKYIRSFLNTEVIENAISWIVVFAMFIYGGAKIIQFDGAATITKPVSEMTGMELMWAFYGYSKTFAIILGALEIVGGVLLLFPGTRIIGCLFTSTLLVNIIIQDVVFEVNTGALRAAILYQLIIFLILWINRRRLFLSLKILLRRRKDLQSQTKWVWRFLATALLFLVFRILEYYITVG